MTIILQAIKEFHRHHRKGPTEVVIHPNAAVALVAMGERIPATLNDVPVRVDEKAVKLTVGTGTRVLLSYGPIPGDRMAVTAHEA